MDLFTGYYSFYIPYKLFMEDKCFLGMKFFETLTHPIITESFEIETVFIFWFLVIFHRAKKNIIEGNPMKPIYPHNPLHHLHV